MSMGDATSDSRLSGWYRFGGAAGTQMYTNCTNAFGYCTTWYPGYLSDGHPGPNDGIVSRTVCFFNQDRCCHYNQSIQVINCRGLYYVYKLNGTPDCLENQCKFRYCSA